MLLAVFGIFFCSILVVVGTYHTVKAIIHKEGAEEIVASFMMAFAAAVFLIAMLITA